MIDALCERYALKTLLGVLQLSESSYCYQHDAIAKGDTYALLRSRLKVICEQNYQAYGYLRMKMELDDEGLVISEIDIRRLMAEAGLAAKVTWCRKYI